MLESESPRITSLTAGPVSRPWREGFTLLEIIVVVVILAMAAAMVVPMISSGAETKVLAAAQMLAADLEYAKSMAMTRGHDYGARFDVDENRFQVEDFDVPANPVVIAHPVNKGFNYVFDFDGGRLDGVQIEDPNFNGGSVIRFDGLGSPHDEEGHDLTSRGSITLQAGDWTQTVRVEPVTGVITIDD
jgi:prepilin-type N-terminal cleavage/methylation domain-containing protein